MSLADIQSMKALKMAKQNASNLREYVWNIDKGLRNWNAAKAKAPYASTPPCVVFFGDSITDSTGATTRDSGFVGLYRNAIQMATGLAGRGYLANNVFTPDGTWTVLNEGTNLKTYKGTPTSTSPTLKAFVGNLDVIYGKRSDGGIFTVKVDGGTVGTIDCSGATSYHNVASFTIGTSAIHTVQIVPATTGNTYIEGFIERTNSSGMIVHQVGHAGICASDYTDPAVITACTSAFNPDLTIIALGTNDAGQQKSITTYSNALDTITKEALKTGDVLIVSMVDRQDGKSLTIPYESYVNAAKSVAVSNKCAYLSLYDRWQKDYVWGNGKGFYFDNVHPSQTGHTEIAEALREILGGMPVAGVFRLYSDSQYVYGDTIMANIPANGVFRPPTIQGTAGSVGRNVSVTQGATTKVINLSMQDGNFAVSVSPNWNTSYWITSKSYAGFTVNFGTAAPASATIDWMLTR